MDTQIIEEKKTLIREICQELGLNVETEFLRLLDSMFGVYLDGKTIENAALDSSLTRMWLAAMIAPKDIAPEKRKAFAVLRELGYKELHEAWKASELPIEEFKETVLYGNAPTQNEQKHRTLH